MTSPRSVNLTRIVYEIDQDLAQPQRVAHQVRGNIRLCGDQELEILFLRFLADHRGEVLENVLESELRVLDIQFAGLDLREVEDIVDDAQKRSGRGAHLRQVITLLRRQVGLQGQMSHADDGIHRRADLVTHVGQEHRFRRRRFFRFHFGGLEFLLRLPSLNAETDAVRRLGQSA